MLRGCLDSIECCCRPLSKWFCCCFDCYPKGSKHKDEGECTMLDNATWQFMQNQCPLPPRNFSYYNADGQLTQEWGYALPYEGEFYMKSKKDDNVYKVLLRDKSKVKYFARLEQMKCVDLYLKEFHINTSAATFHKLQGILATECPNDPCPILPWCSAIKGSRTSHQKIAMSMKPKCFPDRVSFLVMLGRAMLNSYYIYFNILDVNTRSADYRILVYFITAVEAYLWIIRLGRLLSVLKSLCNRVVFTGDTVHYQVKNVADKVEDLSSVSVLSFLPSSEIVGLAWRRRHEWWSEMWADIEFEVWGQPRMCPWMAYAREVFEHFLHIVLPLLSVFALLVKISQLDFVFTDSRFEDWSFNNAILYAAFVNQVAGIRKIKKIEENAVQHLVFSGRDAKIQMEERLLINAWWDYTLVSAISNISHYFDYPIFDSMIFWYKLTPRKIQILIKGHDVEGEDYVLLDKTQRGGYHLKIIKRDPTIPASPASNKDEEVDLLVAGQTTMLNNPEPHPAEELITSAALGVMSSFPLSAAWAKSTSTSHTAEIELSKDGKQTEPTDEENPPTQQPADGAGATNDKQTDDN